MKDRSLTVRLVPVLGNWLACVACGRFNCDFGIEVAGGEQQAGLHKGCVGNVKRGRARKTKAAKSEAAGTSDWCAVCGQAHGTSDCPKQWDTTSGGGAS